MGNKTHVYGPVPSRRLGRSLGVDLVPMKHCPYDCIYCQLGPTRTRTRERSPFYPRGEILGEVEERLRSGPRPDYVTLAGCGEPTLYSGLGELTRDIRAMTTVPVALLTNGALFGDPALRSEAAEADLVLPSLDAGDEESFRYVNRPVEGLSLEEVVDGLAAFRREYGGPIWLEIMVLAGYSEVTRRLEDLAKAARRIRPDRIQLNTPVRPAAHAYVEPVPLQRLDSYCALFEPRATVIADFPASAGRPFPGREDLSERLLGLLRRRPCTLADIQAGLGLHPNETEKLIRAHEQAGTVRSVARSGRTFYQCNPNEGEEHGEEGKTREEIPPGDAAHPR